MPTRDEITNTLRDASWVACKFALTFDKNSCSRHEYLTKSEEYADLAAQVSAMRCESCAKFSADSGNYCCLHDTFMEIDEGCFHHEPRV